VEIGGASGMVTDDSETFRLDSLGSGAVGGECKWRSLVFCAARTETAMSVDLPRGKTTLLPTQVRCHGHCDTEIICVMLEMTECNKFGLCRSHEQNCTLLYPQQVPLEQNCTLLYPQQVLLSPQLMTILLSTWNLRDFKLPPRSS
jgi:hypothetical protein